MFSSISLGAIARADLLQYQGGKETVRIDELGKGWVGRLARLRHCWVANALASPITRGFLDPTTAWRGKTAGFGKTESQR